MVLFPSFETINRKIAHHIFGIEIDDIHTFYQHESIEDHFRHHVYSLSGLVDSIAAAVIIYAVLNLSGILLVVHKATITLGSVISIIVTFLVLLVIIIDDYMRSRIFNALVPCRSTGRFALNLLVIILLGLSVLIFSQMQNANFYMSLKINPIIVGSFFLSLAFLFRSLWAIKANIETHTWEVVLKKQEKEKTDTLEFHNSVPKIPIDKPIVWELLRLRIKRVAMFSFLYFLFFLFVTFGFLIADPHFQSILHRWYYTFLNMLPLIKIVQLDELIINNNYIANYLPYVAIVFGIFYMRIEYSRFRRDIDGMVAFGLEKYVTAEGFIFCTKSIVFIPPYFKNRWYQSAISKNSKLQDIERRDKR